jgi:hypothetical protein
MADRLTCEERLARAYRQIEELLELIEIYKDHIEDLQGRLRVSFEQTDRAIASANEQMDCVATLIYAIKGGRVK